MANKLLQLPGNRLFNNSNIASPGGTATLYLSKTSTLANFLDASSVPLGPTITANGLGQLPDAYGDETVAYRVILRDSSGVQLDGGDIDPFYFGRDNSLITTTAGSSVSTRALLAAIANPVANQSAILTESGREGTFVFSSANLSAQVTADTAQGIYVAPASDTTGASGAWVRKFSGAFNALWFGADPTGVASSAAAITSAIALLKALGVNNDGGLYKGSARLFIPAGLYNMGTTTLDLTHTLIIEGDSSINGYGTKLKWSGDCDAFRVQATNTSGSATVDGASHFGGSYAIIRNLGICGPYANQADFTGHTEGDYHGVRARANVIVEDCLIDGFAGDGIFANTTVGGGGAAEGNTNCSFVHRCKITNVRDAINIDGADANAWDIDGLVTSYCRRWAIHDSSFLGNSYRRIHSANTGLIKGVAATIVSYLGNRYAVVAGQAVAASTNAPSGTTADNAYWLYISAGAADASLNIPAWVSGVSVREGGTGYFDNATARNTVQDFYQEGGEAPVQYQKPTIILSGIWGSRAPVFTGTSPGNYLAGDSYSLLTGGVLGQNIVRMAAASTVNISTTHNSQALASSISVRHGFAQGYEADAVTPAYLASIHAYGTSAAPASAEGVMVFTTRTFGGTGGQTDRMMLDGPNSTLRPAADNSFDFGLSAFRWRNAYAYTVDAKTALKINGTTVLNGQMTHTANLVAAPTMADFNALLAKLQAVGLMA